MLVVKSDTHFFFFLNVEGGRKSYYTAIFYVEMKKGRIELFTRPISVNWGIVRRRREVNNESCKEQTALLILTFKYYTQVALFTTKKGSICDCESASEASRHDSTVVSSRSPRRSAHRKRERLHASPLFLQLRNCGWIIDSASAALAVTCMYLNAVKSRDPDVKHIQSKYIVYGTPLRCQSTLDAMDF